MVEIANPVYDVVFKYMMEDQEIAKAFLGAFLKKEVIEVKLQRNEYTGTLTADTEASAKADAEVKADVKADANTGTELKAGTGTSSAAASAGTKRKDIIKKRDIRLSRIDFGARVREPDGSEHQLLIELQKNWTHFETLRFRRYLAAQYTAQENMKPGTKGREAYPMVNIYLLGHRVGDIEEPILYVDRGFYDYEGRTVSRGLPDAFVDSLTHRSIIVQLPLLHGLRRNPLERMLDLFCQKYQSPSDYHILNIPDEGPLLEDAATERMLTRLRFAAADSRLRRNAEIEEEFASELELKETEVMLAREKARQTVEEAETRLKAEAAAMEAETNIKVAEAKAKVAEAKAKVAETEAKMAETEAKMAETKAEAEAKTALSIRLLSQHGMEAEQIAGALGVPLEQVKQAME